MINVENNFAHDFPEDFHHENGMYQNRCKSCNVLFLGYKRRIICKLCEETTSPDDEMMSRTRQEVCNPLFDKDTQLEIAVGTIVFKDKVIENLRAQIENLRILLADTGVSAADVDKRQFEHLRS
jgi:hypothetical protein